jgi:NAD(P)-dependent dehydrogenase (short-subunit alcohol dehydrogenase family)
LTSDFILPILHSTPPLVSKPNPALTIPLHRTYAQFAHHITTNTIGPLLVAAAILKHHSPQIPISTLVFMSSDSGSAAKFRAFEDGFAAYAASKAALNQGLRHLAAELHRASKANSTAGTSTTGVPGSGIVASSGTVSTAHETVVLALYPGEVATDVASSVDLAWEVEGIITPEESVRKMLRVIHEKGKGGVDERGGERSGVATFWDWEGRAYPW